MASPAALQVVDKSPTKVILDLGCTKAMGSRAAVNHFCKYIGGQGHNTYQIKPTASQFFFAGSQTSKRTEKLVVCMNDYHGSTHCTEFDIVEECQAPFLMSLPQTRNLRLYLRVRILSGSSPWSGPAEGSISASSGQLGPFAGSPTRTGPGCNKFRSPDVGWASYMLHSKETCRQRRDIYCSLSLRL